MTHADLTAAAPTPHHHVMIAAGDATVAVTFEELYAARYAAMVRLAHTLVDTRQRAEEVVQDAFAAVCERHDRLDHPEAYLRVCVLNNCWRVVTPLIAHTIGSRHAGWRSRKLWSSFASGTRG